jgi:hypothetical protein
MNPSKLLPSTRSVLSELEEISGYPTSFVQDPSLKPLASVSIADASRQVHVIRYRPGATEVDYLVAFEAALATRTYRHPVSRRLQLTAKQSEREAVRADLAERFPDLPAERRRSLADFLFDSLLTQLRSCPPGLLVDYDLYHRFPDLRSLQARSVRGQLAENVRALGGDIARQFPPIIVRANQSMNAAYAIAVGELLQERQHVIPYRAGGLERVGLELLALQPDPGAESVDDPALITAWAERLGLATWIDWLPLA